MCGGGGGCVVTCCGGGRISMHRGGGKHVLTRCDGCSGCWWMAVVVVASSFCFPTKFPYT